MRRAAALCLSLAACASAQRVPSPVDPAALRPAPGRVAVRVTSAGPVQNVALVLPRTEATQRMVVDAWCQTPCTLFLPPGEHALYTGSPAVLDAVSRIRVGDRAAEVAALAPSRARWEAGRNLLVGGVGLAALGGIFLAFSPLEVEGGSPTGAETIAVGAAVGVGSALLIALGLRAMGRERAGATVTP